MKLPNQDKFRMPAKKETYKYLGILKVDTIKQVEMKNKIIKGYLRRKSLAESFSKEKCLGCTTS